MIIFTNIFVLNIPPFLFFLAVEHMEAIFLSLFLSSLEWINCYIFFPSEVGCLVKLEDS